MKSHLKKNGNLALTVHGDQNTVPFFSSILDAVTNVVPDYLPLGAPSLDRFGNKNALFEEISKSGFQKIRIKELSFTIRPGTFSEYWKNYLKYIAKPLREKINSLSWSQQKQIRKLAKENVKKYTNKNGMLRFPWKVLILTAKNM